VPSIEGRRARKRDQISLSVYSWGEVQRIPKVGSFTVERRDAHSRRFRWWCPDEVRHDLHAARLRGQHRGRLVFSADEPDRGACATEQQEFRIDVMIVGSMTSAEISCVQRLIDNDQSASC
jgi:hypothetical protein